jgi:hypothetical protein
MDKTEIKQDKNAKHLNTSNTQSLVQYCQKQYLPQWVHAPPQKTGMSGSAQLPLPFLAGGDNAVTCKTPKTQQASLFLSLDLFLPLSDLFLSLSSDGRSVVRGRPLC